MAFISRIVVSSLSIYSDRTMKTAVNGVRRWRLFLDKSVKPLSSAVSFMPMLLFSFLDELLDTTETVVNVLLDLKSLSH